MFVPVVLHELIGFQLISLIITTIHTACNYTLPGIIGSLSNNVDIQSNVFPNIQLARSDKPPSVCKPSALCTMWRQTDTAATTGHGWREKDKVTCELFTYYKCVWCPRCTSSIHQGLLSL